MAGVASRRAARWWPLLLLVDGGVLSCVGAHTSWLEPAVEMSRHDEVTLELAARSARNSDVLSNAGHLALLGAQLVATVLAIWLVLALVRRVRDRRRDDHVRDRVPPSEIRLAASLLVLLAGVAMGCLGWMTYVMHGYAAAYGMATVAERPADGLAAVAQLSFAPWALLLGLVSLGTAGGWLRASLRRELSASTSP